MESLRRMLLLVRPYWTRVVLAVFMSLIVSGLNGALAWLVKPATDNVFVRKDMTLLMLLPWAVFCIFLMKGIFTFFHEYLMRSAAQKMVTNLRNRLYEHIVGLPMIYFGKNSSGELISRVINDTNALHGVVSLTLKDLFIESTTVIVLTGVAFWRRWDLTLISIVIFPAAFYGIGRLGKRMKQISKRAQEKISSITEFLHETFAGIKIIKAFTREAQEVERFKRKSQEFYRENMRATRVSEFASLLMETLAGVGIAFVTWYGGLLVTRNTITVGDFASFLTAIFLIYTPARRLAKVNIGIQQARAPLDRIENLLSEEREQGGTKDIPPMKTGIELAGVAFRYPTAKSRALHDISLNIRKGEIVAIVGKSGGGKTTLVNLLPWFYTPTEGTIYIDGVDITQASFRSLRGQFGIVTQEVILFNDTVRANIAFGKPDAGYEEVVAAAKAAYAYDFIAALPEGLETVIGERGMRLSGGQRQRISIARAILRNPPVLILDEATSALDTDSELMVQQALENLMEDRTTFVIAHRLSTIKKAHRIVVLEKGRIFETGTHEELYRQGGLYRRLYELQFWGKDSSGVVW